jgi:hypothetical protein
MILTVFILALGIGAAVLATTRPVSVALYNRQVKHDEAVLSQAMDALIGRAVADANRPGSLPCPDTNDDGVAEIFAGSHCPSYIGRLPWRTLGLPDPRDASGERLWYSLSSRFRDNSTAEPINTDTKVTPQVNVYLGSTATLLTNEPVAVIFAPGSVVGAQVRDAASKNNPANYLESGAGWDNASATGPYLIAQPSDTMNDRLRIITTAELLTPVERRAAQEILSLLAAYKAATAAGCNCYPWADFADGISSPSGDRDN